MTEDETKFDREAELPVEAAYRRFREKYGWGPPSKRRPRPVNRSVTWQAFLEGWQARGEFERRKG